LRQWAIAGRVILRRENPPDRPKIIAWIYFNSGLTAMFSVPPLELAPVVSAMAAPGHPLYRAKIICDGNSITQSVYGPETSYPRQLEQQLNDRGYAVEVFNAGVSGQTTAHMLHDALWQVDRRYDPDRLNLLIAMEGGNHMLFGASPEAAAATFAKYCLSRRAAGYKVVAIDTFPRNHGYPPGYNGHQRDYKADLMTYNQLIRAQWPDFADWYFDGRSQLPEFDMRPPYMDDGVHPSVAGNARLAAKLATFLVESVTGMVLRAASFP
jgi:acyl-CoA thioesterase I